MDKLKYTRKEYTADLTLDKNILAADPIVQFERWYQDAEKTGITEPNAMTLATVSEDGKPSARMVLLKGFSQTGFTFYTNYGSKKAIEIQDNPMVTSVFWWKELARQVRIEGVAEKVDYDTSLSYFHSRPRGSQIGAWASPQSKVITKPDLETRWKEVEERFENQDLLPLPEFWGGYMIKPFIIEFWQGRENRYHDRFRYQHSDDGHWTLDRIAP
ncbi:MAG: pyridoxamine 5'-phosphate oxidase [Saprospiraceae bacterium]|nr:pyridoxamine 5'-phosphate oxidase [Bacteroidia bacterium]NNF22051.1 pyridoxamine 5'-phosphate oxidase [Saprospiraceae bacterium]